jgi:hypothetical protein
MLRCVRSADLELGGDVRVRGLVESLGDSRQVAQRAAQLLAQELAFLGRAGGGAGAVEALAVERSTWAMEPLSAV